MTETRTMKHIPLFLILLLCALNQRAAYAVTVVECVDEAGNSTFQDFCPPGTTPASQRDIKTGVPDTAAEAATQTPGQTEGTGNAAITFYTTAKECDACLIIKDVLGQYGASFTEKNIDSDMAARQELMEKAGGGAGTPVTVPTVIINDQVISGFSKDTLVSALEKAGYKKSGGEVSPAGETAPAETEGQQ